MTDISDVNSDQLKTAGQINIIKSEIYSVATKRTLDIRNQVLAYNIYESIYEPFITGDIIVKDAMDLINYFPIVGEEILTLTLATPGFNQPKTYIDNKFLIYKISDRENDADRSVIYRIHFISIEALLDLNNKISQAFSGKISDIAETILKDKLRVEDKTRYNVEPTINNTKYVSNFWSPVKNLNYLAEHAFNTNGSPTFLFFENRNGLNFISLETLYKTDIVQKFFEDNYSREVNADGTSVRDITHEYQRIIELSVPNVFDYVDRLQSGAFSSILITHNLTNKNVDYKPFDFLDDYERETRLNKYPLISKTLIHDYPSVIKTMSKMYTVHDNNGDITNSKIFQRRQSLMRLAESCVIEITVLGRTDYTVGQKINVNLNKNMPIDKEDDDVTDYMFSGNYIIASMKHMINREDHEIKMELIKDSLDLDLNNLK